MLTNHTPPTSNSSDNPGLSGVSFSSLPTSLTRDFLSGSALLEAISRTHFSDPKLMAVASTTRHFVAYEVVRRLIDIRNLVSPIHELSLFNRALCEDCSFRRSQIIQDISGSTSGIVNTPGARIKTAKHEMRMFRDQWIKAEKASHDIASLFRQLSSRERKIEAPVAVYATQANVDRTLGLLRAPQAKVLSQLLAATKIDKLQSHFNTYELSPEIIRLHTCGVELLLGLLEDSDRKETVDRKVIGYPFFAAPMSYAWQGDQRIIIKKCITFADALTQSALENLQQGVASTGFTRAVAEVWGPIDPKLVEWAHPKGIYDFGPIPNVAIALMIPLPSGQTYRLVIKESLPPTSSHECQQSFSSEADAEVVKTLKDYFFEVEFRRCPEAFGKLRVSGLPARKCATLESPLSASSPEDLALAVSAWYQGVRIKARESGKRTRPSLYNLVDDLSISTQDQVEEKLRCVLVKFSKMPGLPERVAAALEFDREQFVKIYTPKILNIVLAERSRASAEVGSGVAQKRFDEGYKGPPGGYPLPFERMVMDMLHQWGAGIVGDLDNSNYHEVPWYGDSELYPTIEDLPEILSARAPNRLIELVFQRRRNEVTSDHVKRVQDPLVEIAKLEAHNLLHLAKWVKRKIESCSQGIAVKRVRTYEIAANELLAEAFFSVGQSAAHAVEHFYRVLSAKKASNNQLSLLQAAYKVIEVATRAKLRANEFDPVREGCDSFRVVAIRDYEKVKFIYAIGASGESRIAEEVEGVGRTTHSALLDGKNMYAGGQLTIAKHERVFHRLSDWVNFNKSYRREDCPWYAQQLDEGTGHYKLPLTTLQHAKRKVFPALTRVSILTNRCRVEDAVAPGLQLSW